MIPVQIHFHRSRAVLAAAILALFVVSLVPTSNAQRSLEVVNARIDMTCVPPPGGQGASPPCLLPVGLDPKFISPNPSGRAHMIVRDDDTSVFDIRLQGLAPGLVLTAWAAYFIPPGPPPDPIFFPGDGGSPPVAGLSVPLAPTDAGFTEGLGREPNQFVTDRHGRARLVVELDYNPLKSGQGPLRNGLVDTNQAAAPAGGDAEQQNCCPDGVPAPRPQPVGSSLLRVFDPATGFQVLEANGRPRLLRSPVPVAVLAILVHIDETTHGINAGILIPPIPGIPATVGDHFTLGLFDLREFHLD